MDWQEELPLTCPPNDSEIPNQEIVYRVIENNEPEEIDFHSHRKRFPDKKFNVDECTTRALSVFKKIESAIKLTKLPRHRGKKIIELELNNDSGVIKKTGKDKSHYSWWVAKTFNPLEKCRVTNE